MDGSSQTQMFITFAQGLTLLAESIRVGGKENTAIAHYNLGRAFHQISESSTAW